MDDSVWLFLNQNIQMNYTLSGFGNPPLCVLNGNYRPVLKFASNSTRPLTVDYDAFFGPFS